jgi:hypothetical protein
MKAEGEGPMSDSIVIVSKDPSSGRIWVCWGAPPTGGSLVKSIAGVWAHGCPSADDLKDNFERVTDEAEATALLNEAKAAKLTMPEER